MAERTVGTRDQWLEARKALLVREKELTHRSDELAKARRELPWVVVEKEYRFETNEGTRTLIDLFGGRSQLLVYHFMHGPNTPEGCPGCTFATDTFDATHAHLEAHDVSFVLASRSPLETLNATWALLDRTPKGRDHGATEGWPRRRDEYTNTPA